ncbi:hypothetical protein [Dysgonomonas sp. BGC7]|uniref:hypothetical protein n=1 Tax=Dysgonomonas sp. BGC7 TaxID=1658008 RepID=UPI0006803162|nr:hypothetical protein [Dysgonomonas sp. BGC7]MBD8388618.1 hypothetical protein [Dysgonomonas sp. BGC7]
MNNVDSKQVKGINVHDELIKTIRTAITEKDDLSKSEKERIASVLADILCLGKESVYRRLRGEVRFSFEEVALISQALNFSIDNIVGAQSDEKAIFELNRTDAYQINTDYKKRLEEYIKLVRKVNKYPDSKLKCAFNNLPLFFYLHYDNLSKFRLFKWAYQIKRIPLLPFKDFIIDRDIISAQKIFITELKKIKHSGIIISQDIFSALIREINYFFNLNLLDDEDMNTLKGELLYLLEEMELQSISGTYGNNTEIYLYLSNVNIEASYILIGNNNRYHSHLELYGINGISSLDKNVCNAHNEWIESLKRYSTLITFGGEMQRHKFFQEQRKIVNSLT